MKVLPYSPELQPVWDDAVRHSRNGTFLFERAYMDYHQARFTDASLLFTDDEGHPLGLLPAHLTREDGTLCSHGGLTYGGLVLMPHATLLQVREMLALTARHGLQMGARQYRTKPVPYIYHRYPAEEELYWLFRAGAVLTARTVSACISLDSPLHTALWKRKMKKAACEGLTLHEGGEERLCRFWPIVEEVLRTRHNTRPVHSLEEIRLLFSRFPNHLQLFTVDNAEGQTITGSLLFVEGQTAHVQYMEAGEEARRRRALDWLMLRLIGHYAAQGLRYLDFGISTEQGGQYLNEGLASQKEGFGGRAVCYDTYTASLDALLTI